MERINYVDRAKRIMAQTIRTGALAIVPLAAAVQLHATPSTTLPNGSPQCVVDIKVIDAPCSDGGTNSVEANPLPGSILTGVDLNFSGGGNAFGVASGGSWNSTWTITFSASGDLSGPLTSGQVIPLDYAMSLSDDGTGWNLEFELGTSGNAALYGSQTFSGSQSGSGSLTVNTDLADTSPLVETVVLNITGIPTDFGVDTPFLLLTDPDFQFEGVSPEPASAGLFATGLAFIGWMFRRRAR